MYLKNKFGKKVLISLLILMFLFTSGNSLESLQIAATSSSIDQNNQIPFTEASDRLIFPLTINLIFVGYTDNVDFSYIQSKVESSTYSFLTYSKYVLSYTVDTTVYRANDTYTQEFFSYVDQIKDTNGWTSALNLTALQINQANGNRELPIFYNIQGTAIPAALIDEWFAAHPYILDTPTPFSYNFYFLNLSYLDTPTKDHWFDLPDYDYDLHKYSDYWYSLYSGLENRSSPGWGGGKYRHIFFDPSAYQWYLQWVVTEWGDSFNVENRSWYWYDLERYEKIAAPTAKDLENMLVTIFEEYVRYVYFPSPIAFPFKEKSYLVGTKTAELAIDVLSIENLTASGYPQSAINDTKFDPDLALQSVASLHPYVNTTYSSRFDTLDEYPELENIITSNAYRSNDKWILEVSNTLVPYISNHLSDYFDLTKGDAVLPAVVFLLPNYEFRYQGIPIAGLGGMGWELLFLSDEKLFYPTNDPSNAIPREGYTHIITHEVGHSLGLPHPHGSSTGWVSDFVASTMSYFSSKDLNFSVFEYDQMGRLYFTETYLLLKKAWQNAKNNFTQSENQLIADYFLNASLALKTSFFELSFYYLGKIGNLLKLNDVPIAPPLPPTSTPANNTTNESTPSRATNGFGLLEVIAIIPLVTLILFMKKRRKKNKHTL